MHNMHQCALNFAFITARLLQKAVNVLPLWLREHKSRLFYSNFNKPVNTQQRSQLTSL